MSHAREESPPVAVSLASESTTEYTAPSSGFFSIRNGSKPYENSVAVSQSPSAAILAAIACIGVMRFAPPSGMTTDDAPIVESNISMSPFLEQILRSFIIASSRFESDPVNGSSNRPFSSKSATWALAVAVAPFVSKNAREMETIGFPRQNSSMRPASVTSATLAACRFSCAASESTASRSFGSITTAMRS